MAKTAWIVGVGLVAGTGLLAWAASAERPRERVSLEERLGLSGEQAGQLRQWRSEQAKAAVRRRADEHTLRIELRDLLEAPTLDEAAVRARVEKLAEVKAAAVRAHAEARLALRKLLTPEQLDKLRDARPERGWRGRRGMRPHRGGAPDAGAQEDGPPRER